MSRKVIEEKILEEKLKGTSDIEIGRKYGISFKFLEKLITKSRGINVSSVKISKKKIKTLCPPDFKEEQTTVWSFKQRGNWATHSGEYRGNWSPYIPRNIILKYSKLGDLVLDYFCGCGTTAIECKLLGRKCIALDINEKAIELAKINLDFKVNQIQLIEEKDSVKIYEPKLLVGDARDLSFLEDNSVDLICSHPPYANAIHYTAGKEGDLSFCDVEGFLKEMEKVARESLRVLKPGKICAILIGDIRRKKHVIPLGFKLIDVYLKAGFKLKELVIKRQHNCKTTGFWYEKSIKYNFLLLAHEYLPIFEKPETPLKARENVSAYEFYSLNSKEIKYGKNLDKLETTTVWILPQDNFEQKLNENVIERYSKEKPYSIITFCSLSDKRIPRLNKNATLLFIKMSYFDKPEFQDIELYLKNLKKVVYRGLKNLNNISFIVIQTKDVRINGYIEPLAKRVTDILTDKNLWLKEVIVAAQEDSQLSQDSKNYLKIVHQYLLVYEVLR